MKNSEELYKEGVEILETLSKDRQEINEEGMEILAILRKDNPTSEELEKVDEYLIKLKKQQAQRNMPSSKREDITKEL